MNGGANRIRSEPAQNPDERWSRPLGASQVRAVALLTCLFIQGTALLGRGIRYGQHGAPPGPAGSPRTPDDLHSVLRITAGHVRTIQRVANVFGGLRR